jgi:expansin (peptidoglycan-binding protein)
MLQAPERLNPMVMAKASIVAAVPSSFYVNLNGTSGTNGTYITDVKSQGGCGSCWAFASIAEIEAFYLWRHKLWLDLSEQQMVDCVPVLQP